MTRTSSASLVHALRDRLHQSLPSLVINVDHPSPSLVEFLGGLPLEAVMIDTEQGSPDFESVENMARAARVSGICSLARTCNAEAWAIERLLFRGVDGLVVPRCESMADVRRVVDAFRYCLPQGQGDKLLVVQLEHIELVKNVRELARVDGIDCVFIGPVDLSKSMGFGGQYKVPAVAEAIDECITVLRGAGVPVGMLVKPDDIASWAGQGVSFLYAHANDLLALGAAALQGRIDAASKLRRSWQRHTTGLPG
jgi:2-keto-3-deoxy-L-rhamnonate aldolase RhmA